MEIQYQVRIETNRKFEGKEGNESSDGRSEGALSDIHLLLYLSLTYSYYFYRLYPLPNIYLIRSRIGRVRFSVCKAQRCSLCCLYGIQELVTECFINYSCVLYRVPEAGEQPNTMGFLPHA